MAWAPSVSGFSRLRVSLGYFGLFDLGLGRATTKFVAEALGPHQAERLPGLVWKSLAFQVLSGLVGSLVVAALTPLLVERVLKIPARSGRGDEAGLFRSCRFLARRARNQRLAGGSGR